VSVAGVAGGASRILGEESAGGAYLFRSTRPCGGRWTVARREGSVSRRPARASATQPTGDVTDEPAGSTWRILTVPNLISFVRLLGVPLFLYLFLVTRADVAALVVLAVGGLSDWVDGYVARRLRQVSRLGELLDPVARWCPGSSPWRCWPGTWC
jgi:hypothetical protein